MLEICRSVESLRSRLKVARGGGGPVWLVPTMGALHAGHLRLIEVARERAGVEGTVVVSVFVNPTQFGPGEDFEAYPRTLEEDAEKCAAAGVDVVFSPEASEVYFEDASVGVSESSLSLGLCGGSRPGHFDGVCLVVLKLFCMVQPDAAVFGEKDYQQLAVIRRMVRDLNVPVEVVGEPTVREADGLAMSSRNAYLSEEERGQAVVLRRALVAVRDAWFEGEENGVVLEELFGSILQEEAPLGRVDYAEVVDGETLERSGVANARSVMAVAVFFGRTRLIDNIVFSRKDDVS